MPDWSLPFFPDIPRSQQMPDGLIKVERIFKSFAHANHTAFSIFQDFSLTLNPGECIALSSSAITKKTALLQILNGQSSIDVGAIWINHQNRWVNLARLSQPQLATIRQQTIGCLHQYLPLNPKVTVFEMALEPLLNLGIGRTVAREQVQHLYEFLNLPSRLWQISPTALSIHQQQRVNIARTFIVHYPILLLNLSTLGLDEEVIQVYAELINQRKAEGSGIIGVFADTGLSDQVCTATLPLGDP